MPTRALLSLLILAASSQSGRTLQPDPPIACGSCAGWNADLAPFRVYGNSYYVGTAGLSAMLITSSAGHVLLDGALPQSAPLIDAHVRQLGFRTEDIKLIVTSHAHFDHVGGVAALQRYSGATVAASASSAAALRRGRPTGDDPQFAIPGNGFPRVTKVQTVTDGQVLRTGDIAITAHFTPGHTPGSTTWTWQSCESGKCLNMVYADSLNAVSADGFRFTGGPTSANIVDAFRRSIALVEALPCDVLVSVHPGMSGLDRKLARQAAAPSTNPFIDPNGCRAYAADARATLDKRVAEEQGRSPSGAVSSAGRGSPIQAPAPRRRGTRDSPRRGAN